MEPIERFFWWITERHRIFEKRRMGLPRDMWTEDEILQTYRFTNPFRENDKTTVWFRENMRDPISEGDNPDQVFMATVIFRWFNLIQTGETLLRHNLHTNWDPETARYHIKQQDQFVTGGYIIKTPDGKDKVDGVIWCINNLWEDREKLVQETKGDTLRRTWHRLLDYPYLGPFMSYEIVTDLRHTPLLNEAEDIMTWANAGPGAMRGLNRIHHRPLTYSRRSHDWNGEMQDLLEQSTILMPTSFPALEMRDIEHSLCEFDKYERVRLGEGKPRGRYP